VAQDQRVEFLFAAQVSGQEQLKKLTGAVDSLRKEMEALKAANGGVGAAMTGFSKSVGNASSHVQAYQKHLDAQAKAMRNARQGTQQLGMQFNDLGTSISTGASPMQAFNQQLGQMGYALSMMGGTAGKVGNFLAGPWGAAIVLATMALGPMIDGLFGVTEESKKTKKAAEDLDGAVEARLSSEENLRLALAKTATEYRNIRLEMRANAQTAVNTALVELNARRAVLNGLMAEQKAIEGTISKAGGLRAQSEMATGQTLNYASVTGGIQDQLTNVDAQTAILERLTAKLNAANVDVIQANNRLSRELNKKKARTGKSEAEKEREKELKSIEAFMDRVGKVGMKELPAFQRDIAQLEKEFMELSKTGQSATIAPFKAAVESIEMAQYSDLLKADAKEAEGMIKDILSNFDEVPVSKEMDAILTRADDMQKSFEAIGTAVSDSFKGMLTGAASFKDAMKGIISAVIDELFRLFVVQQIVGIVSGALGGLKPGGASGGAFGSSTGNFLPGIPANAYGGSVTGNKPTLVGERGPELFVPSGNGTIIPNSNMRGGGGGGSPISISVDARGSNDPAAVRAQVQQGILEAAPAIIAAAEARTISSMRRPRLGGAMQ
jgi:hypothetical protein